MYLFSTRSPYTTMHGSQSKVDKGQFFKTRYKHHEARFSFQDNITFSSNNQVVLLVPLIVVCPIAQFY